MIQKPLGYSKAWELDAKRGKAPYRQPSLLTFPAKDEKHTEEWKPATRYLRYKATR